MDTAGRVPLRIEEQPKLTKPGPPSGGSARQGTQLITSDPALWAREVGRIVR
jgi:hypothetical protein